MSISIRITIIALGLGLFTACTSQANQSVLPQQKALSDSLGSASEGYALLMESKTIHGHNIRPDNRPTLLVTFASWCGHCRKELVVLGRLHRQYPGLRIIGLNAYEDYNGFSDKSRLRDYIQNNAPWLSEIVIADKAMRNRFGGIPRIPTMFVYSAGGQVIAEFRRGVQAPPSEAEIEDAVQKALLAQTIKTPSP